MQSSNRQLQDELKVKSFLHEATTCRGVYVMPYCVLGAQPLQFVIHLARVDDEIFHVMLELVVKEDDRWRYKAAEADLLAYGFGRNAQKAFLQGEDLDALSEDLVEIVYQAEAACQA